MIKFTGSLNGQVLLGMGISKENVEKLKDGQPILIHLSEVNLPYNMQIFLFYGETEQDMVNYLKSKGLDLSNIPIHESKEPH